MLSFIFLSKLFFNIMHTHVQQSCFHQFVILEFNTLFFFFVWNRCFFVVPVRIICSWGYRYWYGYICTKITSFSKWNMSLSSQDIHKTQYGYIYTICRGRYYISFVMCKCRIISFVPLKIKMKLATISSIDSKQRYSYNCLNKIIMISSKQTHSMRVYN